MSLPDPPAADQPVTWSRQPVTIPTYPALPPDPNPMFLEKRVYQGSSGRVYPYPFTDRVSDDRVDHSYDAVLLENEYVRLMLLPSLGGRIHMAVDRTNDYNFFYHNRVIKPALVGLLGPWISGGVEFNWPQHHRPTTFMPLDVEIIDNPDGSTTVWMGEVEQMNGLKGMHGVTLRPGSSAIELSVRTYNPTPLPQTFLWWVNVAVHVHDQYESFFPPDVTVVADHAKRAISAFPIARGTYYGVDYSEGVALNWYRNIPVPTSYMVLHSNFDFFGGYDHAREAGFVHVADRHVAPGKKQWTWGNHEFGHAWDRNLTDEDGPYVELMAGAYTDNQPDFSWLQPYETKRFSQLWYPIREIGAAKQANRLVALNLGVADRRARVGLHANRRVVGEVVLEAGDRVLLREPAELSPRTPFITEADLPEDVGECDLRLTLTSNASEVIAYSPVAVAGEPLPDPARAMPWPAEIDTQEELYLAGLHLEQYRHATRAPEPYYLEGLARDPSDVRCNNALGLVLLRRGDFASAATHFQAAIDKLTKHNPNPVSGEAHHNLAVAQTFLGHWDAAYEAFYKATWNQAWAAAARYGLALLDCRRQEWERALAHLEESIEANPVNNRAHNLRSVALRRSGRFAEAVAAASRVRRIDVLDHWCRNELALSHEALNAPADAASEGLALTTLMRGEAHAYLDLSLAYAAAGIYAEAEEVLLRYLALDDAPVRRADPQVHYFLALFAHHRGEPAVAAQHLRLGAQAPQDYCFPNRLEAIEAFEHAIAGNGEDARAHYYLGNLLYDKRRYDAAIDHWEQSSRLEPSFSTVHRNLALGYFNVRHDPRAATAAMHEAVARAPEDARLLYELDQLLKVTGTVPAKRLELLRARPHLVDRRDDLSLELVALHNLTGHPQAAIRLLETRTFHPWEGGEGRVPEQWVQAHLLAGRSQLRTGEPAAALRTLTAAATYPPTLGEGRPLSVAEAQVLCAIGVAHDALGDAAHAADAFRRAATEVTPCTEQTFFAGVALRRLGRTEEGMAAFTDLVRHATGSLEKEPEIDYFATSLPSMLTFEEDLRVRNQVVGQYLLGLGELGLGRRQEAERALRTAAALDPNHLQVVTALEDLSGLEELCRSSPG